ncbi:MAG: glycoside hydrolase family 1 protein [Anaerolineales bacterium]
MIKAKYSFPRGFLWGTSTSSHQVEGNNTNNNWWTWENEPGRIQNNDKSGLACDWWGGRWKEDLDRAAESGQNAHRLSIEWSRVQPAPDRWDEMALDHYREIIRGVIDRNLFPLVALHHFSDPIWLQESGGWESESSVALFIKYTNKIVDSLKEYVNMWITINEPNVLAANSYLYGLFPPGKTNLMSFYRVMRNLQEAHAGAYHEIHKLEPDSRVGPSIHYRAFKSKNSWSPFDRTLVKIFDTSFNNFFPRTFNQGYFSLPLNKNQIKKLKKTQDFLAVDYFTREFISFKPLGHKTQFYISSFAHDDELSDSGMIANVPEFLFNAIKWGKQFGVPIIISGNGIDNQNDNLRRRYLIQHIRQLWKAVNFNYPVKGYFHWTLVDNFEWGAGWRSRFGLWELNRESQTRTKRLSADLYAEICKENCLSSEMVAKYAPDIFSELFPG